jgi:hypothetical protein
MGWGMITIMVQVLTVPVPEVAVMGERAVASINMLLME